MDGDRIAGNEAERTEVAMNRSAFATWLRSLTRAVASPRLEPTLLVITAAALTAGGAAWLAGDEALADLMWGLGTVSAVAPAVGWVLAALRHGRAGVDLIAVLTLGGTLAVHEYLAGALIALMLATGRTLEAAAQHRASHDLRALLHRRTGGGRLRPQRGGNAGGAFELRATATEQDSTYAGIVRLARQAGAESAPLVRLADRYAAWFLPLTLAVAGLAWLLSGSAVRAVAVLVVAASCPLLLAAPVAIVSGISRASRLGVVMRDGGALENLGRARTLLLDKTGTLTRGCPHVLDVVAAPGWQPAEVLRLAASLDQYSLHVLAAGPCLRHQQPTARHPAVQSGLPPLLGCTRVRRCRDRERSGLALPQGGAEALSLPTPQRCQRAALLPALRRRPRVPDRGR